MVGEVRLVVFLFTLFFVRSEISLDNTNNGLSIQFDDCVRPQSLDYYRRPKQPIDLTRDNDNNSCEGNGGKRGRFSSLRSKNITLNTLEQLEEYSLFLIDLTNQMDRSVNVFSEDRLERTANTNYSWDRHLKQHSDGKS